MGFREELVRDLDRVFLAPGEFGEEVEFDGRRIRAVVESVPADALGRGERKGDPLRGVFDVSVLLYCRKEDFPRMPVTGERVNLNGDVFVVRRVADEMGMLVVALEANES